MASVSQSATCLNCGCGLFGAPRRAVDGHCATCRDAMFAAGTDELARSAALAHLREKAVETHRTFVEARAVAVDGKPWWYSGLPLIVVPYTDVDSLNNEARFAAPAGWTIQSMSATDGHFNVGRAALGFALAGALGAAAGSSRTAGTILVAWFKPAPAQPPKGAAMDPEHR